MATTLNASTSLGYQMTPDTSGVLQLQTANTTAVTIDASQNVGIGTSSPTQKLDVRGTSSPTIKVRNDTATTSVYSQLLFEGANSFSGTSTSYIQSITLNGGNSSTALAFGTNADGGGAAAERARIDSNGNLLVGASGTVAARLYVKGSTTTSGQDGIAADNSAGSQLLRIRNDGVFYTGNATFSPYNNTTGSAANVFVGAAGDLYRSTSSIKYKKNVVDAVHGLSDLLTLRAVTYEGKSESDKGKTFGGLIAEEVHEAGLTEFVQYAEDGTPDALAYGNMVSLCIKAIQEQQALITTLTERITVLEGAK